MAINYCDCESQAEIAENFQRVARAVEASGISFLYKVLRTPTKTLTEEEMKNKFIFVAISMDSDPTLYIPFPDGNDWTIVFNTSTERNLHVKHSATYLQDTVIKPGEAAVLAELFSLEPVTFAHQHEPIYVCIQTISGDEEVIDSARMYVDKGWSLDDDSADNGYSLLSDLKHSLRIPLYAEVEVWIENETNPESAMYTLGTPITEDSILYVYEADNSVDDGSDN